MQRLVDTIARALRTHRFRFRDERELQAGIDQVLRAAGLTVAREHPLGDAGTIDFLIRDDADALGLEVKVKGTRADVTRQVHRYLQHAAIPGVMLVTTRAALAQLPPSMSGKPVFTHHLVSGAF